MKDFPFVSKLRKSAGEVPAELGTTTVTDVRGEVMDRDKPRSDHRSSLGTETLTERRAETTDKDR